MRDDTIEALHRLDSPTDIGKVRARIEWDGARIAAAAAAPIRTTPAMLLLFDVLVGITRGTLRHRQDFWFQSFRPSPRSVAPAFKARPTCGTYRCLAGWISEIAFPGSRPAEVTDLDAVYAIISRSARLELATGEVISYAHAGARALGVSVTEGRIGVDMYDVFSEIEEMWAGGNSLGDLWYYAEQFTGGAIVIPDELRERVGARAED
jgi:hypothetical protein